MGGWHETRLANVALRGAGLGLLFVAGAIAVALHHRVHGHAPHEANLAELALAALLVSSALLGNALLIIGPALWKFVEVPGRRSFTISEAGALGRVHPARDAKMPHEQRTRDGARPVKARSIEWDDNEVAERRFG